MGSSKHIFIDFKEKTDQNHNATAGRAGFHFDKISKGHLLYDIGEI